MNLSKYTGYSDFDIQELVGGSWLEIEADRYRQYITVAASYNLIKDMSVAYLTELRAYILYKGVEVPESAEECLLLTIQLILNDYIGISQATGFSLDSARRIFYVEYAAAENILPVEVLALSDYVIKKCLERNLTNVYQYVDDKNSFDSSASSTGRTVIGNILNGILGSFQGTVNNAASDTLAFSLKDNAALIIILVAIAGLIIYGIANS